jgi:hypothetical protein
MLNMGGDPMIWIHMRDTYRTNIAFRFFSPKPKIIDPTENIDDDVNKNLAEVCTAGTAGIFGAKLRPSYLSYFYEDGFSARALDILVEDCCIVATKSQLCKFLYRNGRINMPVAERILQSWRKISFPPELVSFHRFDTHEICKLLLISDRELRRQRLDLVTSASEVRIRYEDLAKELPKFHFPDCLPDPNLSPWIHLTITPFISNHKTKESIDPLVKFYLEEQKKHRTQSVTEHCQLISQATNLHLPKELYPIIALYLVSHLTF